MAFRIDNIYSPFAAAATPKRLPVQTGVDNRLFLNDRRIAVDPNFWRRTFLSGDSDVVAIQLAAPPAPVSLPIGVRGSYAGFRAAGSPWTVAGAPRQFRLVAVLQPGLVIESGPQTFNPNADDFDVVNFTFRAGITNYAFSTSVPWTWTIESMPVGGQAPLVVHGERTTAIELYVFVGDMHDVWGGTHWAEVLRWAIPDYAAFAAQTNADTHADAQHRYINWLTPYLFTRLSAGTRLSYDTWNGSPTFLPKIDAPPPAFGKTRKFELSDFLNAASRWPGYGRLNCFTLAAFVGLCCKAYGNERTNNGPFITADLRGTMTRWGYVPAGELFGWPQYPNLNNPLFNSNDSAPNVPANSPQRTAFTLHWWAEFTDAAGLTTVFEICKARLNGAVQVLAHGNIDRVNYFATSIEQNGPLVFNPPAIDSPSQWDGPPVLV